jgi:hypothetical protein
MAIAGSNPMLVTPSPRARACVDVVVCTAAMCVAATQQLRVFLLPLSVSLSSRRTEAAQLLLGELLLPGGSKRERARERERVARVLFGMVLCRAHSKKRKRANANRRIENNLAICNPDSVARSSAFPVSF